MRRTEKAVVAIVAIAATILAIHFFSSAGSAQLGSLFL
jgi:hypothetical protein